MLQAFGGLAMMTAKLHHAAWHVVNQLACQGPGANFKEFWIERMIWYLKVHLLKDRAKDKAEVVFVNDHLLVKSAQTSRHQHPDNCRRLEERKRGSRSMAFPTYDTEVDSALLLGPRVVGAGVLSDSESLQVLNLLPTLLRASTPWYRAKGWPVVDHSILAAMHGQGKLLLDKFRKASLPSMHVIASVQDETHFSTTNQWIYVPYTYSGINKVIPCVAEVQYFVRVRAVCEGLPIFDASDCAIPGASDDLDSRYSVQAEGQIKHAYPIRLAVCKLWLADECETAPCGASGDKELGVLPDLLCVSNVGDSFHETLPTNRDPRGCGKKRYFGYHLVDIVEVESQLIPSIELAGASGKETSPRVRYFMTCSKMSGL